VFELAGASVAVVRPRVNAMVRRLDNIFRVVGLCIGVCGKRIVSMDIQLQPLGIVITLFKPNVEHLRGRHGQVSNRRMDSRGVCISCVQNEEP